LIRPDSGFFGTQKPATPNHFPDFYGWINSDKLLTGRRLLPGSDPVRKDLNISVPLWLKTALDGKTSLDGGFKLGSFFWTLMHFHWLFCGKIGFVS